MKSLLYSLMFCVFVSIVSSCTNISQNKTILEIVDNKRHYYPILRGQELEVVFTIKNIGENPFILNDLLVSCGCIVPKQSSIRSIAAGKEGTLRLIYNSAKNIGYVKHHIDIYGNLKDQEKIELVFDTNVVPGSDYVKDYEEIHKEQRSHASEYKSLVDGNENEKGYYLDFQQLHSR